MRGPYGFDMSDSCENDKLRKFEFFHSFSQQAMKDFDAIKSSSVYPEGAVLFLEKQEARGVFVLCDGEIKLTVSSSEGKTLILRIAKPGEILGLMATLSGEPYELTAETLRQYATARLSGRSIPAIGSGTSIASAPLKSPVRVRARASSNFARVASGMSQ